MPCSPKICTNEARSYTLILASVAAGDRARVPEHLVDAGRAIAHPLAQRVALNVLPDCTARPRVSQLPSWPYAVETGGTQLYRVELQAPHAPQGSQYESPYRAQSSKVRPSWMAIAVMAASRPRTVGDDSRWQDPAPD
jgi:hypothetical protein